MVIIGSRGSRLALWQAEFVKSQLSNIGTKASIKIIKTKGDIIKNVSFDKMEGKGFFTKEIEEALLNKEIDIAVHSMKDLSTTMPEGLILGAVSERENPSDCLLLRNEIYDAQNKLGLPENATVGTSSARRASLLNHFRSDLNIKALRGNVPTRIQKLRDKEYDAIVLAQAGINRLNLDVSDLKQITFNPREFVPAPAQGVLAYQCRKDDLDIRKILAQLHKNETAQCTNIERTILNKFDGGCQLPLGVYCEKIADNNYRCYATFFDGKKMNIASLAQSTTVGLAENLIKKLRE